MTRKEISEGIGNISSRYIQEAADYAPAKKNRRIFRAAAAAVLALCLLAGGIGIISPTGGTAVAAYAYGTDEELTSAGAVLSTGTIRDNGEMTGHPLCFYLTGEGIKSVRFSCREQYLSFMDWTEQRAEYGNAQNFTVPYGPDESEYRSLTIDWTPVDAIRALTDNGESSVAPLPEELRRDLIVMEITFESEEKAVKALTVELREDGKFAASFDDYTITGEEDFLLRPDAQPIGSEPDGDSAGYDSTITQPDGEEVWERDSAERLDAARAAALDYYARTVFTVERMEFLHDADGALSFSVLVSKGGVVQEPERTIMLTETDGAWSVVNEGY